MAIGIVSAVHGETITTSNYGGLGISQNGCDAQTSGNTLTIVASNSNPSCTVVYQTPDFMTTTITVTTTDNTCTPSDSCSDATEGLLAENGLTFDTIDPPEDPQDEKV